MRQSNMIQPICFVCPISRHIDGVLSILKETYHQGALHVLSLLYMEQVLALHGLLQEGAILQHQSLDLVQQVTILLLQVSFQLAQQLTYTQTQIYQRDTLA